MDGESHPGTQQRLIPGKRRRQTRGRLLCRKLAEPFLSYGRYAA